MKRCNRYNHRDIIIHYLKLSTDHFGEDTMFKLVMFDYLSFQKVKNGVFVRVGQDPQCAVNVMKISPQESRTVVENRLKKRGATRTGQKFVSLCAQNVVKSVNASVSRMWGSNEEHDVFSRKLHSMTIIYGAPSVFWTLTPNADYSITAAFWTNKELPNGRPHNLADCTFKNMPRNVEMAKLTPTNTVVQAQYYRLCCQLLVECLFGWDITTNKPKRDRDNFGNTEALFFATEQQRRLRIHLHVLHGLQAYQKLQVTGNAF